MKKSYYMLIDSVLRQLSIDNMSLVAES